MPNYPKRKEIPVRVPTQEDYFMKEKASCQAKHSMRIDDEIESTPLCLPTGSFTDEEVKCLLINKDLNKIMDLSSIDSSWKSLERIRETYEKSSGKEKRMNLLKKMVVLVQQDALKKRLNTSKSSPDYIVYIQLIDYCKELNRYMR